MHILEYSKSVNDENIQDNFPPPRKIVCATLSAFPLPMKISALSYKSKEIQALVFQILEKGAEWLKNLYTFASQPTSTDNNVIEWNDGQTLSLRSINGLQHEIQDISRVSCDSKLFHIDKSHKSQYFLTVFKKNDGV